LLADLTSAATRPSRYGGHDRVLRSAASLG
jgi:hypothetical protein